MKNAGLKVWAPASVALAVVMGALVLGQPRPSFVARIYGGPIERAERHGWRLELFEWDSGELRRVTGRQAVLKVHGPAGGVWQWQGRVAGESAEVEPRLGAAGPERLAVSVQVEGQLAAAGTVRHSAERWQAEARRGGGWLAGHRTGRLRVDVAPGRGAWVIPFGDPLLIQVTRDGQPVRALASVELHGATVEGTELERAALVCDGRGQARLAIVPRQPVVEVTVGATWAPPPEELGEGQASAVDRGGAGSSSGEPVTGRYAGGLPVELGAMWAKVEQGSLVVASPVARERAYFALVTETARWYGGSLELPVDGRGFARGRQRLPSGVLPEWGWLIVSSEPGLTSGSTLGWPVAAGPSSPSPREPRETFSRREALLLDGLPLAELREATHRRRVAWAVGIYTLGALLVTAGSLIGRVRQADRAAGLLWWRFGISALPEARRSRRALWVALACLGVGFFVMAWIVLAEAL